MSNKTIFIGEIIGTFILVFIGCGSVALAVVYEFLNSLFEVALFWTAAVILGIYCSSKLSGAHLNPAVSIAFLVDKQISIRRFWDAFTLKNGIPPLPLFLFLLLCCWQCI